MLSSKIETVHTDMRTLVKDAQELFREAASVTGEKAETLRAKGMSMLEAASAKAQDVQAAAIETGKEIAESADDYVRKNPWQAVGIAAGVGLLIGVLIARR